MKKSEYVCREILTDAIERGTVKFTQLELSNRLRISLSTVNNALKPLEKMGAVDIGNMNFKLVDKEKLLMYWASKRALEKDIIYQTRVDMPVSGIEKSMPAGVAYTAYSGYKFRFKDVPADYSEVYVYAGGDCLEKIKNRFPKREGYVNLVALRMDDRLKEISRDGIAPAPQLYADLWNLGAWYAKEFAQALEKRMNLR